MRPPTDKEISQLARAISPRDQLYVLDADNTPRRAEPKEWARWVMNALDGEARNVAKAHIGDRFLVSTVFLACNMRPAGEDGPPLLWETLVEERPAPARDFKPLYRQTYSSHADALDGHAVAVCETLRLFFQEREEAR